MTVDVKMMRVLNSRPPKTCLIREYKPPLWPSSRSAEIGRMLLVQQSTIPITKVIHACKRWIPGHFSSPTWPGYKASREPS